MVFLRTLHHILHTVFRLAFAHIFNCVFLVQEIIIYFVLILHLFKVTLRRRKSLTASFNTSNIIHILGYVHVNKLGNIFMAQFRCHLIQVRSSLFRFISSPNPNPKHNSATACSLNAFHRLSPHSTPRRGGLKPQPEFPVVSW